MQEEIKITGVTVFVNPYTEPDAEEEKTKDGTNAEDEEKVKIMNHQNEEWMFFDFLFGPNS